MNKLDIKYLFIDYEQLNIQLETKKIKVQDIFKLFISENDILQEKIVQKSQDDFENTQRIIVDDPISDDPISDEKLDEQSEREINDRKSDESNSDDTLINDRPSDRVSKTFPDDINNIYRKIVKMTHPDKKSSNESYLQYYKDATKAKDDHRYIDLIIIAYKLDIRDVFDLDSKYFDMMNEQITFINNEFEKIETNPFWIWYHTPNQKLKDLMKEQIIKFMK